MSIRGAKIYAIKSKKLMGTVTANDGHDGEEIEDIGPD
jgi:hypothetical protein